MRSRSAQLAYLWKKNAEQPLCRIESLEGVFQASFVCCSLAMLVCRFPLTWFLHPTSFQFHSAVQWTCLIGRSRLERWISPGSYFCVVACAGPLLKRATSSMCFFIAKLKTFSACSSGDWQCSRNCFRVSLVYCTQPSIP